MLRSNAVWDLSVRSLRALCVSVGSLTGVRRNGEHGQHIFVIVQLSLTVLFFRTHQVTQREVRR